MIRSLLRVIRRGRGRGGEEITPEDIFLDSSNLPSFNVHQFEGRLERPIKARVLYAVLGLTFLILLAFGGRAFSLQVLEGDSYREISENNRLEHSLIFSERGVIRDRNEELIAWNESFEGLPFARRVYSDRIGLFHTLGYINYPKADSSGNFFRESYVPRAGAELYFDNELAGENGVSLVEVDAHNRVRSQSVIRPPLPGTNVTLALDAKLTEKLYQAVRNRALESGFVGGSVVIMDVTNGEIVALTSYPEFDSQIITDGEDRTAIGNAILDSSNRFLNRVTQGLYSPGSIMKPYVAVGGLEEGIITANTTITSDGALRIPNPFNPGNISIFRDWGPLAYGTNDVTRALAVSSNVFFFEVGGGFETREGLGINRLEEYFRLFGFGSPPPYASDEALGGTIPNPEWKAQTFDGEIWRIGDTYNTAIGQYGMQVTPLQIVRAVSAIANGGVLREPVLKKGEIGEAIYLPVEEEHLALVRKGMRLGTQIGTAQALNVPYVSVGAKTGTAELGVEKDTVNSVTTGFFPYENPKYAFVVLMERGPRSNLVGASAVMREVFDWMHLNTPEYFGQ